MIKEAVAEFNDSCRYVNKYVHVDINDSGTYPWALLNAHDNAVYRYSSVRPVKNDTQKDGLGSVQSQTSAALSSDFAYLPQIPFKLRPSVVNK